MTTKEDLITAIKILEELSITYWIDGGWGIDIDFDVRYIEKLLKILKAHGYKVETN